MINNWPKFGRSLTEKLHLMEEDLTCGADGKSFGTINDLREFVYGKKPGDSVELEVMRGESRKVLEMVWGRK